MTNLGCDETFLNDMMLTLMAQTVGFLGVETVSFTNDNTEMPGYLHSYSALDLIEGY